MEGLETGDRENRGRQMRRGKKGRRKKTTVTMTNLTPDDRYNKRRIAIRISYFGTCFVECYIIHKTTNQSSFNTSVLQLRNL